MTSIVLFATLLSGVGYAVEAAPACDDGELCAAGENACFSRSRPLVVAYLDESYPSRQVVKIGAFFVAQIHTLQRCAEPVNLTAYWKAALGLSDADFYVWFPEWTNLSAAYVYGLRDGVEKTARVEPLGPPHDECMVSKNAYWISATVDGTVRNRTAGSKPLKDVFTQEAMSFSDGTWEETKHFDEPIAGASALAGASKLAGASALAGALALFWASRIVA